MRRYKITMEYDGSQFYGWQKQIGLRTVQSAIEDAIHSLSQELVNVYGAGRTDSGVHALGQVAHFDLPSKAYPPYIVQNALNYYLKHQAIVITNVELVETSFHARFSATQRVYSYRILNRACYSPLLNHRVWHVKPTLDHSKMHEAAQSLVGQHDFTSFRSMQCQAKSAIKTIDYLTVERTKNEVVLNIASRSFLHNQVRIIAGNLCEVGKERCTVEYMKQLLEAKDRTKAFITAPPHGLYLAEVRYEAKE